MITLRTDREHYDALEAVLFHMIRYEQAAVLDSSLIGELGQYTMIGVNPYLTLEQPENGAPRVNGKEVSGSLPEILEQLQKEHFEENPTHLPMISGAIGYISYEYGRKKEGVRSKQAKSISIPDSIFVFYDNYVVADHQKGELTLTAAGKLQDPEKSLDALEAKIRRAVRAGVPADFPKQQAKTPLSGTPVSGFSNVTADFTKEAYKTAVSNMIRYIVEGDIYIVNMTQQMQIQSTMHPEELFFRMRKENPSPFGAYLSYDGFQIVCASPERFLKTEGRKVWTRPIKGTRKRGSTPEEDAYYKKELETSEKEKSELLMIVDLERNDLNRVCEAGSVTVPELFSIETYATVFHLIAQVNGKLREENGMAALIQAAFPGGSITGAPKLRAMELIAGEEHSERNLYTGSIGFLAGNGDCDLNIVIRTAVCRDGIFHLGVGGGITCESDTEFEYEETLQKARAFLNILGEKEKTEDAD